MNWKKILIVIWILIMIISFVIGFSSVDKGYLIENPNGGYVEIEYDQ